MTFTATVAPTTGSGVPTGTVTFSESGTTLGTGTLNSSGAATFSTSTLAVGSDIITATYSGDATYASSSNTVTETITAAGTTATTTAVTASPSVAVYGQSVALAATVSPTSGSGEPTGTVTFSEGSTTLGTATLESGTATLNTSTLAVGSDTITASYSGDATYAGSSTEIGPNSLITTVAGNGTAGYSGDNGQATAAELDDPAGVAVDSAGDLFIADTATTGSAR